MKFAGDISKKCFKNAFENAAPAALPSKSFFASASKDIFSDFKESDELSKLQNIQNIWSHLSKEHYADIFKHSKEVCELITFDDNDHQFQYAADLDAACFKK